MEFNKNWTCKQCMMEFDVYSEWTRHFIAEHVSRIGVSRFHCDVCDFESEIFYEVVRHHQISHSVMYFSCKECGRSFDLSEGLENHVCYEIESCVKCNEWGCVCGPPSDDEYEFSRYFDENDFITRYIPN